MWRAMVDIDGRVLPLEDCDWVFFESCGCPVGMMIAETLDEWTSWRQMFGGHKAADTQRRRKVSARLVPKDKLGPIIQKVRDGCPHTPLKPEKRCEQCGRIGTAAFKVYPATEFTPRLVVCRDVNACRKRWPRKSEDELDALAL